MLFLKLSSVLLLIFLTSSIHQSAGSERMKRQIPEIPNLPHPDLPGIPSGLHRIARDTLAASKLAGMHGSHENEETHPHFQRVVRQIGSDAIFPNNENAAKTFFIARNRRAAKGRGSGHLLTKSG